jgi:hypothetical protein
MAAQRGTGARPAGAGRALVGGRGLMAGVALALALAAVAGCSASHGSAAGDSRPAARHSSNLSTYGGYASYLPKSALNQKNDVRLTGTTSKPALTSEGDGVEVRTPGWSVLMTVSGPEVPGEGLPYQTPATTCTWIVTMSGATGRVPVAAGDFTSIDHLGAVYRPVFVKGQPVPPKFLRPGQRISFELRAVQVVGEGLMRWAPDGHHIVAKWDFEVEND